MNRKQKDFEKRKKQVIQELEWFIKAVENLGSDESLNLKVINEDMGISIQLNTHMHSKYIK